MSWLGQFLFMTLLFLTTIKSETMKRLLEGFKSKDELEVDWEVFNKHDTT